ncbi:homoserine O-succinyltransferase [Enterococcus massiliensis]|uniref:homoserine O-succinyltransferase n=1 Tax=Enterococcus massiliensis TaxID=1640685 RepID=UPI00065E0A79|nr:homoserine O-succinyltransferase [Enterococcus massiliensis]
MPINVAEDFPAKFVLEKEDIFAIDHDRAIHQDIRPLKIAILNLMPNKIDSEIQLLRLISQSPLQIDIDFIRISSHEYKNTSITHLNKFYQTFGEIRENTYDGLIITGAPIEKLPFEEVNYWEELKEILNWSQTNVTSTLHICWGAQAALYHHYGVGKTLYPRKLFGIYANKLVDEHRLTRGFDDLFYTPQSRYTGLAEGQIDPEKLRIVARNSEIGATILVSADERNVFVLGHFEYDTETLKKEYLRDHERGLDTDIPENYFHYNHLEDEIINRWRSHAHLFYHNWLNDVYQITPYRLADIRRKSAS